MISTYTHVLTEDVHVLFFYSYEVDDSGDWHTPNGGTTIDINKVVLSNYKVSVDITDCVEELCNLSISDIEDTIQQTIEK